MRYISNEKLRKSWNNIFYENYVPSAPTLTTVPPSWNYQDYVPIPVGYFIQLHDPDFWEVYANKYECYCLPFLAVEELKEQQVR